MQEKELDTALESERDTTSRSEEEKQHYEFSNTSIMNSTKA